MTVVVKNIEGQGSCRDVELEYAIPRDGRINASVEHGILLFHTVYDSGLALRYRPSRLFLAKRALLESVRCLIGTISFRPKENTVTQGCRVVIQKETAEE